MEARWFAKILARVVDETNYILKTVSEVIGKNVCQVMAWMDVILTADRITLRITRPDMIPSRSLLNETKRRTAYTGIS